MAKPRVKLGLRNASDSEVVTIARKGLEGVKDNSRFPDPPVHLASFERAIEEFRLAIAVRRDGGKPGTVDKNEKRRKVESFIRKMAAYIDYSHNDDPETLLASGFPAKNPNRAPSPIPKAIIKAIKNGMTAQLVLTVWAIKNAKTYELQYALVSEEGEIGPWRDPLGFTNSRSMRVNDLKPGTRYIFQIRGIGTMGPGDWSDPVGHMCL